MIPKVIHYCWFGHGQLPSLTKRCIASWQKYLPDYDIKQWNEDNFDVNIIPYTSEAYREKKYAFVSDYARLWILYHYGGLYLDTDVELIKPMDHLLASGAFMCAETSVNRGKRLYVASGLGMASYPFHPFIKKSLDFYESIHFYEDDGTEPKTTVELLTSLLDEQGLKQTDQIQHVAGLTIYPWDYMCPIDTEGRVKRITENTVSIHHYMASWNTRRKRFKKRVARILGSRITVAIIKLKRILKNQYNVSHFDCSTLLLF